MSYLVGLTGGIGCGKSTVAAIFAQKGIPVIDTDLISHQLTQPGGAAIPAIRAEFGQESINPEGALDRSRIRQLIFADAQAKQRLEAILHPLILQQAKHLALNQTSPYVIVVVPLLFESGQYQHWLDRTLAVDCPEEMQISRAATRSGLTPETVKAIMQSQIARQQRLQLADDVIHNEASPNELSAQIDALHQKYLRATSHSN